MGYVYDDNDNLIKYPTTYLDYHYGGWSEIVERYSNGNNKIVLQYDKDDNLVGAYCYDENGNMMMDEEGHPIVPEGWN